MRRLVSRGYLRPSARLPIFVLIFHPRPKHKQRRLVGHLTKLTIKVRSRSVCRSSRGVRGEREGERCERGERSVSWRPHYTVRAWQSRGADTRHGGETAAAAAASAGQQLRCAASRPPPAGRRDIADPSSPGADRYRYVVQVFVYHKYKIVLG